MSASNPVLDAWKSAGVELVELDVNAPSALERACEGAGVVVSAVQGNPDVIVQDQRNLLDACCHAGVQRDVETQGARS